MNTMENFDKTNQIEEQKDFENGEEVAKNADKIAEDETKGSNFVNFFKKTFDLIRGKRAEENPKNGDNQAKTAKTIEGEQKEKKYIKDKQGGGELNTGVEKRGE